MLKKFYKEGGKTARATADYEIHCAGRKAFRSDLNMEVLEANGTRGTVRTPQKTPLAGKEYKDFVGLMEILCSRE